MRGFWKAYCQFQLSELVKVVDRQCSIGLNARWLGKDAVVMSFG